MAGSAPIFEVERVTRLEDANESAGAGSTCTIERLDRIVCGVSCHTQGTYGHCLGCGCPWEGPGSYCMGVCDCQEPACACDCEPCPTCGAWVDASDCEEGTCPGCPTWPLVEVPHAA